MAQQVLVDLDLNSNSIHELADGLIATDATNKGQLDLAVAGVAGNITTETEARIDADALLGADIDALEAGKADKTVTVTAGNGLSGGGTLAGPDIPLSVFADPTADNILVVGPTGLYVPPPGAVTVPVQSVTGAAPIVVTDAGGAITVSLDSTVPTNIQAAIDAGDATVSGEVDTEEAARIAADALKADKAVTVTPGLGLQGGGTLAGPNIPLSVLVDPTASNALTVGPTGLYVPTPDAVTVPVQSVTGTAGQITASDTDGAVVVGIDPAYTAGIQSYVNTQDGLKVDKTTSVIAGVGLSGGGALSGSVTLNAIADPIAGNQLTVSASGLLVPAAGVIDFPVDDVNGTAGQIAVTDDGAGVYTVGIDPVYTTTVNAYADAAVLVETNARIAADGALQTEVDAVETGLATEITNRTSADTALGARIDGITITGTGAATATEAGDNQWTVHVESLSLSNTYTGTTGVDSATINTDVAAQGGTPEPGDLYINTDTGIAYISTGGTAPDYEWVELASPTASITSVTAADASITIPNPAGPAVTVAVSSALQAEITASTTTNTAQDAAILALQTKDTSLQAEIDAAEAVNGTQDGRLTALEAKDVTLQAEIDAAEGVNSDQDASIASLEAASHAAATGAIGNAVVVDGAGQVVSLTIDPASGAALTQSATGLLFTAPLSAKKFAGDVTTLSGTGTVIHGLNTTDVVVSVKNAEGCYVTASVCEVDANTVSVEAADGTYRVTVIG